MKYLKNISKKIGVFSNSTIYDSHINSLRKMGVNALKIKAQDNLEDFSCVLIDLQYPLEMGYSLINKIACNENLSQINIFAIVASRTALNKLTEVQNVRICSFLSINTLFKDLVLTLEAALSPNGQPKKAFKNLKVQVKLAGIMTHISESGALILSPVCFKDSSRIQITSPLIDEVFTRGEPIYKISKSFPSPSNAFLSDVNFLNLSQEAQQSIRKMIIGWSLK